MFPKTCLVTGTNRGVGLGLVKFLLESENPPEVIFAACRHPSKADALKHLLAEHHGSKTKVLLIKLDVLKEIEIADAERLVAAELGGRRLDLLINNAGINHLNQENPFCDLSMVEHFRANCVAPVCVTKAFVPLMETQHGKETTSNDHPAVVAMISSQRGSVEQRQDCRKPAYAISKTALNMASKLLSIELKDQYIAVNPIHPGWVRTDIGGPDAPLSTAESARCIMEIIRGITMENSGQFYNYDGTILPW